MHKTKLLTGILLVLAVLFAQVGTAFAAPAAQETTTISGTIQSITTETDQNGVTTVLVTLQTTAGETQTVRLSAETAQALGLVSVVLNTNTVTVDQTKVGQAVNIDSGTVLPQGEEPTGEAINPVAAILAKFFGVEPGVVQGYHDNGYGFGVIAQAMWMAKDLSDGEMAVDAGIILDAKKSGDYSAFTLPDGSTPTNWGQFKKAIKGKNNLGVIVSGHADTDQSQVQPNSDHGNGNGNGNGYGRDNNPGKGKDKGKNKNP